MLEPDEPWGYVQWITLATGLAVALLIAGVAIVAWRRGRRRWVRSL
jgi:hypothetical protein